MNLCFTEFQVKEEMISGTPTEMVILYSDLLKVEIDEDGEQLPHSTTPINSPAKSKKKIVTILIYDCRYDLEFLNCELKLK